MDMSFDFNCTGPKFGFSVGDRSQVRLAPCGVTGDLEINNIPMLSCLFACLQRCGFGSFSVSYRPPRTGRNPATGQSVEIGTRYALRFKPGSALRERVNAFN